METRSQSLIANIDGSLHPKSGVAGWGFIIKDEDTVITKKFGEVPSEFALEHEQYAFAKLMEYVTYNNIHKIHIRTDLEIMARKFSVMTLEGIYEQISKFSLAFPRFSDFSFTIEHISRKDNKEADTLAKSTVYNLFRAEQQTLLETQFPYLDKGVSFMQFPKELKFSTRSSYTNAISHVFSALKNNHKFYFLTNSGTVLQNISYKKTNQNLKQEGDRYIYDQKTFNPTCPKEMSKGVFKYIKKQTPKGMPIVIVTDELDLYCELVGQKRSFFNPNTDGFQELVAEHNEIFVFYRKKDNKAKAPKKRSKSLKNTIKDLPAYEAISKIRHQNTKRIRQMMISILISEFENTYSRKPNKVEMEEILKQTTQSFVA